MYSRLSPIRYQNIGKSWSQRQKNKKNCIQLNRQREKRRRLLFFVFTWLVLVPPPLTTKTMTNLPISADVFPASDALARLYFPNSVAVSSPRSPPAYDPSPSLKIVGQLIARDSPIVRIAACCCCYDDSCAWDDRCCCGDDPWTRIDDRWICRVRVGEEGAEAGGERVPEEVTPPGPVPAPDCSGITLLPLIPPAKKKLFSQNWTDVLN